MRQALKARMVAAGVHVHLAWTECEGLLIGVQLPPLDLIVPVQSQLHQKLTEKETESDCT